MKVGFIRVSTEDQNTIRQEILMKQLGVGRNTFYRRMWDYEDSAGIPRRR